MKKLMSVIMSVLMSVLAIGSISVTAEQDILQPYRDIVNEFNEYYGTSYEFYASETDPSGLDTDEKLAEYYSTMTRDEFWDNLYDKHLKMLEQYELNASSCEVSSAATSDQRAMTSLTQRYYYALPNNSNSLNIVANHISVGGVYRYSSIVSILDFTVTAYPCYQPLSSSWYSLKNNSQQVLVDFMCECYVDAGVHGIPQVFIVMFNASGGNGYPSSLTS